MLDSKVIFNTDAVRRVAVWLGLMSESHLTCLTVDVHLNVRTRSMLQVERAPAIEGAEVHVLGQRYSDASATEITGDGRCASSTFYALALKSSLPGGFSFTAVTEFGALAHMSVFLSMLPRLALQRGRDQQVLMTLSTPASLRGTL